MRFVSKECPHAPFEGQTLRRDPPGCPCGDYRVGRRTVVKALSSAWPKPRKGLPPMASKLEPFKPAIDEMLKADLGQTSGYTAPETKWWARRRRTHHKPTRVGGFRLR